MVINISCKFEKASYNIFSVRAVTVKSLYTLWQRRNKVKSIVSTGCYPVDTINIAAISPSGGGIAFCPTFRKDRHSKQLEVASLTTLLIVRGESDK